jgi:flagellar protein FliO/FliZ
MTQTIASVIAFLVLLALLPLGIRWVQRRSLAGTSSVTSASRIVSVLAVGPHQRVVTVEIGPEGDKTGLVLGVTAQTITCLHTFTLSPPHSKTQGLPVQNDRIQL